MNRPQPLTNERIFNDPELMESVGHYIRARLIDDAYVKRMAAGQSHEEATIGSLRDAGMVVPEGSPIAAQNDADAALVRRYQLEQDNRNLRNQLNAPTNPPTPNRMRLAGTALAGGGTAAGLIALIDYLQSPKIETKE